MNRLSFGHAAPVSYIGASSMVDGLPAIQARHTLQRHDASPAAVNPLAEDSELPLAALGVRVARIVLKAGCPSAGRAAANLRPAAASAESAAPARDTHDTEVTNRRGERVVISRGRSDTFRGRPALPSAN